MKFVQKTEPSRSLVGLEIRSNNSDAGEDIPAFWGQVMESGVLAEFGDSTKIYAVYTDYSCDWTGSYTMMLAVEAGEDLELDNLPEGVRALTIPEQEWATTTLADGEPQTVWSAWNYIWNEWEERQRRTYEVDLEIYRFDGEAPAVELQIGLAQDS